MLHSINEQQGDRNRRRRGGGREHFFSGKQWKYSILVSHYTKRINYEARLQCAS